MRVVEPTAAQETETGDDLKDGTATSGDTGTKCGIISSAAVT